MKYVLLLVICVLLYEKCAAGHNDVNKEAESGADSAYIENALFMTSCKGYQAEGRIQFSETKEADIGNVFAFWNTELTISGTLLCEGGDLQIIYSTEDDEKMIIVDVTEDEIDTTIDIPKGKGKISFRGEDLVCQFSLNISSPLGICYSGF